MQLENTSHYPKEEMTELRRSQPANFQINSAGTFSDCSELRRYLAFLPDERRSIAEMSEWLSQEDLILPEQSDLTRAKLAASSAKSKEKEISFALEDAVSLLEDKKELLSLIVYHIARLHASYRATLVSLYFEQRSMRDTAALLGKSLSTVKRYRDAAILDVFFRLKQQELNRYPIN